MHAPFATLRPPPTAPTRTGAAARLVALAMLTLGACSSDNEDPDETPGAGGGSDPTLGTDGAPAGSFVVVSNPADGPSAVTLFAPDLATQAALLQATANEGTTLDASGALFQNGDDVGTGRVGVFRIDISSGGAMRIGTGQRLGKGLEYISGENLLASCDVADAEDGNGTADLKLYAPDSGDPDAEPVATVDLPAPCWDTFWEAGEGRLYAALTDGRLAILDDFSTAGGGGTAVDRLVTPTSDDGLRNSTNLHGVFVEGGTVLVSDVGEAGSSSDGQLFVLDDANGELDGDVPVTPIGGPATRLGNPVDVVLLDGRAIAAEKSNNVLLVFDAVTELSGDVAPSYSQPFTRPESIQLGLDGNDTSGSGSSLGGR